MSNAALEDKDLGWNALMERMGKADKETVKIGILGNAEPADDGADMILIAMANEFGTGDGRVPPRPFIRGAFDKNAGQLSEVKAKLYGGIVDGKVTVTKALSVLGRLHQGQVQAYIVELRDPPNAESTIERKGSDNPLIDTGRLRNSVSWEVDEG